MSKTRKTVEVVDILWTVNYFLKHSPNTQGAERVAHATLLEMILAKTSNYVGYIYLELKHAGTPQQNLGDESRRFYYINRELRTDYEALTVQKKADGFEY